MGVISPIVYPGVNFFSGFDSLATSQNLLSQIGSTKSLSEVDPMESLRNITAPLDNIWKAVDMGSRQLHDFINNQGNGIDLPAGSLRPLKSNIGSRLGLGDTSLSSVLGIAKSAVVLMTNIFIAVLEITSQLLRGILELVR